MRARAFTVTVILFAWLAPGQMPAGEAPRPLNASAPVRQTFPGRGVVQELPADGQTVIIKHEAISNYMAAMTMPFHVQTNAVLASLHAGDEVTFRLNVTSDHSWVDQIRRTGNAPLAENHPAPIRPLFRLPSEQFMDYPLTNELGQPVCLNDFRGQALALAFFYTRCPLPDFCPRLSKNFQEASAKLRQLPGAPTNWHFLSISFDTAFDSPAMLRAYGDSYLYQPSHWSFLTGAPDQIHELAEVCGVNYTSDSGGFNHNFRTLIIDASGHLQMVFPFGGNISDDIVTQIIKGASVTNQTGSTAHNY